MVEPRAARDVCPHCAGRGWVVELDGTAGTARPCTCASVHSVPRLHLAAGIPPRYQRCTLAGFEVSHHDPRIAAQLLAAQRISQRFVDEFVGLDGRDGRREAGLLYIGPPGVGKTHLAVAVLGELIDRFSVRGLFVDFTSLIHDIQSTFDPASRESKQDLLAPVIEAEVLVLDELGAQKPTAWVNDLLYLILNQRYTHRRTTLFTTNYRLEQEARGSTGRGRAAAGPIGLAAEPGDPSLLATRIPPMLISRLYEMAQPVVIDASDYRRSILSHRHRLS